MRILCCSDSHGNIEAVNKMIRDVQRKNIEVDTIIFAGDFTRGIGLPNQQQQFEDTLKHLNAICNKIFYVLGNRDVIVMPSTAIMPDGELEIKMKYTGIRPSEKYGTYLGCDYEKGQDNGTKYEICEGFFITGNRSLIDNNTVYVEHSPYGKQDKKQSDDYPNIISKNALLHVTGHTHKGVFVRNYLNTNFLYRDDSHGANAMFGDYFLVDMPEDKKIRVQHCPIGPMNETNYDYDDFKGKYYSKYHSSYKINLQVSEKF